MAKGTIQNREDFLANITKRLGREQRPDKLSPPTYKHQPQKKVYQDLSQDDLVEVLKKICGVINTKVHETDAASLPKVLGTTVDSHGGGPIVTSDDPHFLGFGLGEFLERKDVHVWDPPRGRENITIAEEANIGVTFSDITLAESGTIVSFSNAGKGRTVSLLPKTHIAVIPKSTIVPRMTQAAQKIHEKVGAGEEVASYINFASGPSNSADIELKSVVGVHGPVRVTYIIVKDR
ncbi:MAG TPA: lactate utilization protein C [Bacillales bacterium]|nr:lactate utilization protein C [Bacillales bacterium]